MAQQDTDPIDVLTHAICYCDEVVAIIAHDPEQEFRGYDAQAYQSAANILENALRELEPAIIICPQCELLSINGVTCHETGCPNAGARYDSESGEWIKQRKCFTCGCTVDTDDLCCDGEQEEN